MVGNASGIDLNNATVNELGRIGGIGPVLAARIVDRRRIVWAWILTITRFGIRGRVDCASLVIGPVVTVWEGSLVRHKERRVEYGAGQNASRR